MERVLSPDERIRRAEELYARRRMQVESRTSATVNVDARRNNSLTKKLIIQFVVCVLIYVGFYAIKNAPNIVSQEVMYKISDILEYDINVQELYNKFNSYINSNNKQENEPQKNPIGLLEETLAATDTQGEDENIITEENPNENVQAESTEESTNTEVQAEQDTSSLSQMEIDAEYIKANYVIMKPLDGEITSRFGPRNPTNPIVPKYHTGIDIARVTGTVILAAMEGDVELVSSEGDLRKPCKNNKWRSINSVCTL